MSETENISSPQPKPETAGTAAPIPPPVPPTPRRRRRFLGFFAIAILVLLAGAISLTVQRLRTSNAGVAELTREVATLKNDVAALNARADALEESSAVRQSAAAQMAELTMRLDALGSDVARAADRDTLAQLKDRIAGLEHASPGEMFRIAAATLARANLARAAEQGAPFKPQLEALRIAAPEDPALGALQSAAGSGVTTRAVLAARFADAARQSLDAERSSAAGGMAWLWASTRRLISVRRVGDVAGITTEDRLARAQADLARSDLENAVMEVRGINGAAAMPLQPWLKDAEERLALDRTIADINARIVQTLAAPASEIAPPARQTSRPANTPPPP